MKIDVTVSFSDMRRTVDIDAESIAGEYVRESGDDAHADKLWELIMDSLDENIQDEFWDDLEVIDIDVRKPTELGATLERLLYEIRNPINPDQGTLEL